MSSDDIGRAIDGNDLNGLLHLADDLADARDWDAVVALRERARRAIETGRQLWPASSYAEYLLALEAPAEFAALVVTDDAGRFALGPLAEVVASTHRWDSLASRLPPGPAAGLCAHERVVRGDTVDPASVSHAEVLSAPLALARWEPEYFLPTYRRDRVDQPGPEPIRGRPVTLPVEAPEVVDDPEVVQAVRDLVRPWTAHSEGAARVVAVRGEIADAIAAIVPPDARDIRGAVLDAGEALATLGWVGASGGRHGRRRGAAAGRDLAWVTAGALTGFEAGERLDPLALGDAISELRWFAWSASDVTTGWVLRLAVEDPIDGIAWACDAVDRA